VRTRSSAAEGYRLASARHSARPVTLSATAQ
jgi:hypothetical protein